MEPEAGEELSQNGDDRGSAGREGHAGASWINEILGGDERLSFDVPIRGGFMPRIKLAPVRSWIVGSDVLKVVHSTPVEGGKVNDTANEDSPKNSNHGGGYDMTSMDA